MKEFIGKTKMKQWFIKEIKPFVKQYNFSIGPRYGIQIIFQENEKMLCYTSITVGWSDHLSFGGAFIRYKKVEDILFQITGLGVYENTHTITAVSVGKTALIEKHQDVIDLANYFEEVFPNEILPAFEKYSDPKNVLELWDSLDEEGRTNHFFDPYNYTKILILSKLINEDKYENRKIETLELYEKLKATGKHYHLDKLENLEKVIRYIEENEI
jgi:hypothetical protein